MYFLLRQQQRAIALGQHIDHRDDGLAQLFKLADKVFAVKLRRHTMADIGFGVAGKSLDRANRTQNQPAQQKIKSQDQGQRSEEHTSELQSLMRISYAVFCLKKQN